MSIHATRYEMAVKAARPRGLNHAGSHCKNRLFEWTMGGAMVGIGVIIAFWPGSIDRSLFSPLLDVMTASTLMLVCALTGIARTVALWWNGQWPIFGPLIRGACAVVGAIIWLALCIAMVRRIIEVGNPPPPTLPVYLALFVSELISAARAALDVRLRL